MIVLILFIPEPHGPNIIRNPYSIYFDELEFQISKTLESVIENVTDSVEWMEISALKKELSKKNLR